MVSGQTSIQPHYSPSAMDLTILNEHIHLSCSPKGAVLNAAHSVVKGRMLARESALDPRRNMVRASLKSDDLTACLSALLSEDKCGGGGTGGLLCAREETHRVGDRKGALTSFII